MIHVLPGGHRSRIGAAIRHEDTPGLAGEEGIAPIQFPTVAAPIHHLLLEPRPPLHRLGVAVINEAALALPPFPLVAIARQVTVRPRLFVKRLRVLDPRVFAGTVHHTGHPQDDAVAPVLEAAEELLRLRVALLIHLEVVVAVAPRAINQDGAHRQIVLGISLQQLIHIRSRIDVVFPQPAFQRPGRRQRHNTLARLVERTAPKREQIDQVGERRQKQEEQHHNLHHAE